MVVDGATSQPCDVEAEEDAEEDEKAEGGMLVELRRELQARGDAS